MQKESYVIESAPEEKHRIWKILIIILIIVLLLAIFAVISFNIYKYITTPKNETNVTVPLNTSQNTTPVNPIINNTLTNLTNTTGNTTPPDDNPPDDTPTDCTPNCTGKVCGSDGCEGTCGTCNSTHYCNATQQCVKTPANCTHESGCSGVGSFCDAVTKIPYTCALGTDGCLDRVNATACSAGYICHIGACVKQGICGNGIKEAGELCDDGSNNGNLGYCNSNCKGLIGNYYVSQLDSNCNDNGPGTSSQPWCTLNRSYTWYAGAGNKVQEGNIIIFRNGNYGTFREHTNDAPGYLFYRNNWITYKADAGHTPVLNSISVQNLDKWAPIENGRSYLRFVGFNISNGARFLYTSYIQLIDCDFRTQPLPYSGAYAPYFSDGAYAVSFEYNISNVLIENCTCHHGDEGIYMSIVENVTVRNNRVYLTGEDSLKYSGAKNLVIENNILREVSWTRGPVQIFGTKTSDFIEGETIVQEGTGSEGVYWKYITTSTSPYALVFLTKGSLFLDTGHGGGQTVKGLTSGATITPVTKVDPRHNDILETHSNSNYNVIINNNTAFSVVAQGITTYGMGGTKKVVITNNLVYGPAKEFVIEGITDVTFVNNTAIGSDWGVRLQEAYSSDKQYALNVNKFENNLVEKLTHEAGTPGKYVIVENHGANIFGNNPNGAGSFAYPFNINEESELVNYNFNNLFMDYSNNDFRPLESSPACDGSLNNKPETPIGAPLPCSCRSNSDCIFGGSCIQEKCVGTKNCLGTDKSCGTFPNCINCNQLDGCYQTSYRDYSCSAGSCTYTTDDCTDCSCSCEGYGIGESIEIGNCNDGIDNDCDSKKDNLDSSCQVPSGFPQDYSAYFRFEGSIKDYTGNNAGKWYGAEEVYSNRNANSKALEFDAINDYIKLPNSEYLDLLDDFTISVWVNSKSINPGVIIAKGDVGQDYRSAQYGQYGLWKSGSGSSINFLLDLYNSTAVERADTGTNYNINQWKHVVGVWDGATAKIYVDGNLAFSEPTAFSQLAHSVDSRNQILIGVDYRDSYTRHRFNGSIDDLIVYKRALSESEIRQIYCSQGGSGSICGLSSMNFARIWKALRSLFS